MLVRALLEAERSWAAALVAEHFGSATVVSRGVLHDTCSLPGLIALSSGQRINRPARTFYQAAGWRQCAVHRGSIREARRLKPQIPLTGHAGIPIEDEIEFEFLIDRPPRATD